VVSHQQFRHGPCTTAVTHVRNVILQALSFRIAKAVPKKIHQDSYNAPERMHALSSLVLRELPLAMQSEFVLMAAVSYLKVVKTLVQPSPSQLETFSTRSVLDHQSMIRTSSYCVVLLADVTNKNVLRAPCGTRVSETVTN